MNYEELYDAYMRLHADKQELESQVNHYQALYFESTYLKHLKIIPLRFATHFLDQIAWIPCDS